MERQIPTKLVVAVVQIDDAHDVLRRLVESGFGATRINAAGGFLRRENAVILVAIDEDRMTTLMGVLRRSCRTRTATWLPTIDDGAAGLYSAPIDVEVGGAVVFTLPLSWAEFLGDAIDAARRSGEQGAAPEGT